MDEISYESCVEDIRGWWCRKPLESIPVWFSSIEFARENSRYQGLDTMVQLYIPAISFFPLTLDHDPKYFSDPETKRTRVTSSLIGTYCWKLRFSWFLRVDFRSDLTRRRQNLIAFQKNNLASISEGGIWIRLGERRDFRYFG